MYTGKKQLFQFAPRARSAQEKECVASTGRVIAKNALLLGVIFAFSLSFTAGSLASSRSVAFNGKNIDARWLPWIGSWRLVSDIGDTAGSAANDQYLMTTSPGDSENAIIMEGYRAGQMLFQEMIEADGVRRSIEKDNCTGWRLYDWSKTGKRLLFQGESVCTGDLQQAISGISIIEGNADWLDIQLMQNEAGKTISIRKYRNVDTDAVAPGLAGADPARFARVSAGTGFTIDEIIELSGKLEPEVLEAALIELQKPFPVNKKQILRMADSGVPERIVDLVVALSFPNKFTVGRATASRVQKVRPMLVPLDLCPPNCYWPCGRPMFYGLCAASFYSFYDCWYLDRYYWPGWHYHSWWYPVDGGGGYRVKAGRLDNGLGYTRVDSGNENPAVRYARPRNAPAGQAAGGQQASSYPSSSSTSSSTSAYSSGSSSGSGSYSPTASPSGYSSGRSSGD